MLGPEWQNIAENHRIPSQKKIAFSCSDPGDTLKLFFHMSRILVKLRAIL